MYTQCPDCEIVFKVTADVLKQAAGKVRCGGCGHAFNALAYLSEQMPTQPVAREVNAAVPELLPESTDTDDALPHSISAEQSAALLKTLDQLAGSDIRIEDTGVEWRVLDQQEAAEPAADDDNAGPRAAATIENVDELLDNTETPIDEFLTATPEIVDVPEIFDEGANVVVDELRFDDNTPLPDDFDLEAQSTVPSLPPPDVSDNVADAVAPAVTSEFSLSEPDEWTDILGEFEDLVEGVSAPLDDEQQQLDLIDAQQEPIEAPVEHFVAPMTEAEQTVNRQIDQELMALAVADDDGCASTVVMAGRDTAGKTGEQAAAIDEDDSEREPLRPDDESAFETIIMEGEFVRSALERDPPAADAAQAAELAAQLSAHQPQPAAPSGRRRYGVVAGVVGLALLLALQIIHQSREALATMPAFNNTIGQVYRAIGSPVQPAWDIAGWRIEASNDTIEVEAGEENLTVYARIGNESDRPLPYPLVSISLTDRFLEVLGNQILDPVAYLPTDLDPRKLVEPGRSFDAVVSIKSPPDEASGYKVDVCYRMSSGQLRCKANNFK